MTDTAAHHRDHDQIVQLCERLAAAHAERDVDALSACFVDDAVNFGLAPPLGTTGINAEGIAGWFATWTTPITVETTDVDITVDGDVAWSSGLSRMRGTKTDGTDVDMWFRTTMAYRRTADGWRIAHEHASVPMSMDGADRALIDLTPA